MDEKKYLFFRRNKHEKDALRYDEKIIISCLGAWVSRPDLAMRRMKRGEIVRTPFADYFVKTI